jgi:hypothetical protein
MSQDIKLGGFSSRSNALEDEDSDEEVGGGKTETVGSDIEEEEEEAAAEFDPEKDMAVDDDPEQIKAALAAKARAQAAAYQKTWDAAGSLADRIAAEAELEVSEEDATELAALLANLGVRETIQNLLGLPINMAALALAMLVRVHKQQTKITQVLTALPPKVSVVLAATMPGEELELVLEDMEAVVEAQILTGVPQLLMARASDAFRIRAMRYISLPGRLHRRALVCFLATSREQHACLSSRDGTHSRVKAEVG